MLISEIGSPAACTAEAWNVDEVGEAEGGFDTGGEGEDVRGCEGRDRKESWEERGEGVMREERRSAMLKDCNVDEL